MITDTRRMPCYPDLRGGVIGFVCGFCRYIHRPIWFIINYEVSENVRF